MKKEYIKLRRPCIRCGEMFRPTGKACRLCEDCFKASKTGRTKIPIEQPARNNIITKIKKLFNPK